MWLKLKQGWTNVFSFCGKDCEHLTEPPRVPRINTPRPRPPPEAQLKYNGAAPATQTYVNCHLSFSITMGANIVDLFNMRYHGVDDEAMETSEDGDHDGGANLSYGTVERWCAARTPHRLSSVVISDIILSATHAFIQQQAMTQRSRALSSFAFLRTDLCLGRSIDIIFPWTLFNLLDSR